MDETIDFKLDVQQAVDTLKCGGILLYPTDTVWGLGCDATNSMAVKRIFEIKHRSDSKALITLVGSEAMLERYVENVPEIAWQLIDVAVRPLTIVYDKAVGVAPELLAADGSIGIRLTHELYCSELLRRLNRPIVSTSANISGEKAPATFNQIAAEILNASDYTAHYRRNENEVSKRPSDVIKITGSGIVKVLR